MRPNHRTIKRNELFQNTLNKTESDIIILTETNSLINFDDNYCKASTVPLPQTLDGYQYEEGEVRVMIFSKYPFIRQIPTADAYSSVCVETQTPFGKLIIYGTIIGFLGGKNDRFKSDLIKQTSDLRQIIQEGNVCFSGDLNISFSGYPYPGIETRSEMQEFFRTHFLNNLTGHFEDSAIHTVISNQFLESKRIDKSRLHFDKKVTDHNLVIVSITEENES